MSSVEPILIFRIGSLGDTVVALPCFHRIEQSFPHARRILVTDTPASSKAAPVEAVLGGSRLVDEVIYFPPPPRRIGDFARLRAQIRKTGARTLVYVADRPVTSTLRDLTFFKACGVARIIGSPLSSSLQRLKVDPTTGETEREAERLARCLAPLGPLDLTDPAVWDLRLQPRELEAGDRALGPLLGRPFVAVSMGGKVAAKDWGQDNWRALLAGLSARWPELSVVIFGSGDEAPRADDLIASWPGDAANLCGALSPRESAAAIRQAQLFVGHDCGPLHLAAAVGTPCVGLYGNHNMPKWWHPMGPRHRIIHDMTGVGSISVSQVEDAIGSVLSGCGVTGAYRASRAVG